MQTNNIRSTSTDGFGDKRGSRNNFGQQTHSQNASGIGGSNTKLGKFTVVRGLSYNFDRHRFTQRHLGHETLGHAKASRYFAEEVRRAAEIARTGA